MKVDLATEAIIIALLHKAKDMWEFVDDIEKLKCPECGGTGQQDDARPGDISINPWMCPCCKGQGLFVSKKK